MKRRLLLALGWVLVVIGLVLVATGVVTALSGDEDNPGGAAGALVIFIAMTAAGIWLLWSQWRTPASGHVASRTHVSVLSATAARDLEHRILSLAAAGEGRVTIAQVALRCGVSLTDAKDALSRLVHMSVAVVEVSDSGDLVYTITGLLPDATDDPSESESPSTGAPHS